jgi:hypothetical protein
MNKNLIYQIYDKPRHLADKRIITSENVYYIVTQNIRHSFIIKHSVLSIEIRHAYKK